MSGHFDYLFEKRDLNFYINFLEPGDFILFKNGTFERVAKHKKGSHTLVLESGRQIDLYTSFESILVASFDHSIDGKPSKEMVVTALFDALKFLNHKCKYHAYVEVIKAVLNGEEDHYASDYFCDCNSFGTFADDPLDTDTIERLLVPFETIGFIRKKQGKHNKEFYVTRKDGKRWHRSFVWYVCYGSNMCKERFMCYITGKGNDKYNIIPGDKCKDQSPIVAVKHIRIPYEMYFGNSSSTWDNGGVSFIKKTNNYKKYSFATAYLITEEQYQHVWNRESPTKSPNWYGNEIDDLEMIDGIPAKTFTSKEERPYNKPCQRYINVIRDGLIEWGLTYKKATQYLFCKIKHKE